MAEFSINKGIGRTVEYKGLKAQYLFIFAGGLIVDFIVFVLAFFPFGKEIEYGGGAISLLANILWLVISGIPLAAAAALNGVILCCTVIGIPFGLQCFKIAKLALMPFGATVR